VDFHAYQAWFLTLAIPNKGYKEAYCDLLGYDIDRQGGTIVTVVIIYANNCPRLLIMCYISVIIVFNQLLIVGIVSSIHPPSGFHKGFRRRMFRCLGKM
jgi:hypothetical protein